MLSGTGAHRDKAAQWGNFSIFWVCLSAGERLILLLGGARPACPRELLPGTIQISFVSQIYYMNTCSGLPDLLYPPHFVQVNFLKAAAF